MQKKSEDFSVQEALRLAKSPAGRQLIAMLQRSDNGQLQQAMQHASNGDYTKASQTLSTLLGSEEAQSLLKELGR